MKKRILLVLLTLALLAALAISLYAAPAEDPAVLNQVNAAAVQMTFPTDGTNVRQTCPYCNENALWLPLASAETKAIGLSGHYYLPGDMTSNTQYYIPYDNNVCLHLNGHDIKTTSEYAIEGKTGYEFNIMGNGNVEATGSRANGTVAVKAGTVRLFGGTYTTTNDWYVVSMGAADTNLYMYDGATINGKEGATSAVVCANAAKLYLYGGTINANNVNGFYLTAGETHLAGVTVNARGNKRGVLLPENSTAKVYQSAGSIYGSTAGNVDVKAGSYTLTGGSITEGSVYVSGTASFAISGAPKVELLNLADGTKLTLGDLTGMAEPIPVIASGVFTTELEDAEAYKACFVPADGKSKIEVQGNVLVCSIDVYALAVQMTTDNVFSAGGDVEDVTCPYCQESVTWKELPAVTGRGLGISGHYYLPDDREANVGYYYTEGGNACLHLNGHNIETSSAFALSSNEGYELNVMGQGNVEGTGSNAGGTVYVGGTTRLFGGTYTATNNFYVVSLNAADANLYMYNGTTINGKAGATSAVVCANAAKLYLYGGTINVNNGTGLYLLNGKTYLAGVTVNAAGGCGVNVVNASATVEQSAGTISGATKSNVYMTAGTYTLSGGEITGGNKGGNGGNVMLEGTGVFHMTGGTISKGTAYNGGNVYIAAGTLRMENGIITEGQAIGGTTDLYYYYGGGNIYVNDAAPAVANISGGTVSDGTVANNSGGNILCRGAGTLTVSGGNITGGTAGSLGGNIMNGASANVTISGGTISEGKSNTLKNGGRYHGDNVASFSGTLTVSGGTIKYEGTRVGAGIFACYDATLILDGDAQVTNSGKTGNIYVSSHLGGAPKLQVKSTFTGEAGVQWDTAYGYGATVDSAIGLCDSTYTGKLYYEGLDSKPDILGVNGSLVIGTAQLVGKDGTAVWYMSNADAVAAYGTNTEYLMTGTTELTLPDGNYTVDLAGQNMTITGTGNVTCFDSANDTYETFGSLTLDGPNLANEAAVTVDGKTYFKLEDNGAYSFHRANYQLTGVSLRPSIGGIYYTGKWEADDMLKTHIEAFGVVVNLNKVPDSSFSEEDGSMWTAFENSEFQSGVNQNGALISNIVKDQDPERIEKNAEYGKMKIHAAAYITVDGQNYTGTGASSSLFDVLDYINTNINDYAAYTETMRNFMDTWDDYGLTAENGYDFSFEVE